MSKKKAMVEYDSNNSGGSWWLSDQNWKDLEAAGWVVEWGGAYYCNSKYEHNHKPSYLTECPMDTECEGHRRFQTAAEMSDKDRWLGCLAKEATRYGLSLREAVAEWERVTGMSSTDAGCPCCGQPHYFAAYDDAGEQIESGPHTSYEASW